MNPTFERYKFLCNMTRSETDPIYAATPMFTTIPQLPQAKSPRQLLGSYVRLENIKPLSSAPSKSPEPKNTKIINEEKENEDDHNGSIENEHEQKNDDKENQSDSGSNRSDEQENVNDDILGDDHITEIVEQIFHRDGKN
jgi:hypothetical protein